MGPVTAGGLPRPPARRRTVHSPAACSSAHNDRRRAAQVTSPRDTVRVMTLRPGSLVPRPTPNPPSLLLARDHDHAPVAARLRAGVWERVGRGAYVPTSPPLSAVHQNLRTPHWFSHQSAALVWGLPLWRDSGQVHVRQEGRPSSQRDRTVSRHRGGVEDAHLTVVGGVPVTDLEQTMVDCARSLPPLAGLVVADAALRAGADREAALAILEPLVGRAGVARARLVVELADEGSESPGETATRFVLLREGLPRPQTQIAVPTTWGTFWADLGWQEWRALVEYDGRTKYTGVDDLVREKRREDALRDARYRVLRVVKEDLRATSLLAARATRLLPAGVALTPRPLLRG